MTASDTAKTRIVVERKAKIVVDGVELTVKQTTTKLGTYVLVKRKVGRDRKRKLDLTGGIETKLERGDEAISLLSTLKQVVALRPARCTCDYRYGYSDHAEHCQSIYVSRPDEAGVDDD